MLAFCRENNEDPQRLLIVLQKGFKSSKQKTTEATLVLVGHKQSTNGLKFKTDIRLHEKRQVMVL